MRIPPPTSRNHLPFHQAIADKDSTAITQLRQEGHKPVALDEHGDSPIDKLAKLRDIDQASRNSLHHSLLASMNPTAPKTYIKPEAFHGSPWGFEILQSGTLKGGLHDHKGGTQSLEGQVFFSERNRLSPGDTTTREQLRILPRDYARGAGPKLTAVKTRGNIYMYARAFTLACKKDDQFLSDLAPYTLLVRKQEDLEEKIYGTIQTQFAQQYPGSSPRDELSMRKLKIPNKILMLNNGEIISGKGAEDLIKDAVSRMERELVNGKLPFLNILNKGDGVPIVFGFSKVNDTKIHQIYYESANKTKEYSYISDNHNLAGSERGGKLKEIEVRSEADLATLMLACQTRGVDLPEDVLIRISPSRREKQTYNLKAHYMDNSARQAFQNQLLATHEGEALSQLNLEDLQYINQKWRQQASK